MILDNFRLKNYDTLKNFCRNMFLMGYGNLWYENGKNSVGNDKNILYRLFSFFVFSTFGVMVFLEMLAALYGDYPEEEAADSVILSVSHVIVVIKMYLMILHKEKFKLLNEKMVRICEAYENNKLRENRLRLIKFNVYGYACSVFIALFFFLLEGVRRVLSGSHFVTVITYYPSYDDNSFLANFVRIYFTFVLLHFMICMVFGLDGFTVAHLIMYKYKFTTLRKYFETLRDDVIKVKTSGNPKLAAVKLSAGLIEGIVMHQEMLGLIGDLDDAFGTMTALQLFLCSGTAVANMLQIALSDISLVGIVKMVLFTSALALLLGLSLCNAGEILYEASLLSDTIFYCGWHEIPTLSPPYTNHSKLVLLALMQAQRPLVMKAFKMIELTYATYLQVGRITYSVFALFYAQNKKSK